MQSRAVTGGAFIFVGWVGMDRILADRRDWGSSVRANCHLEHCRRARGLHGEDVSHPRICHWATCCPAAETSLLSSVRRFSCQALRRVVAPCLRLRSPFRGGRPTAILCDTPHELGPTSGLRGRGVAGCSVVFTGPWTGRCRMWVQRPSLLGVVRRSNHALRSDVARARRAQTSTVEPRRPNQTAQQHGDEGVLG